MARVKVIERSINPPEKIINNYDDAELQHELKSLVEKITGVDIDLIPDCLDRLKFLIHTATCSMTSVPKPLKYLSPFYSRMVSVFNKLPRNQMKRDLADILSVLAMAGGEDVRERRDCLKYCVLGNMSNVGQWGHEYIRQLEGEVIEDVTYNDDDAGLLFPLIVMIVAFDCMHHAEIQACDFLVELGKLNVLGRFLTDTSYLRVCMYLDSCAKYVSYEEFENLKKFTIVMYIKGGEHVRALFGALQLRKVNMASYIFGNVSNRETLIQMAHICSRQIFPVLYTSEYRDEVNEILQNLNWSSYFSGFQRNLGIWEAKTPEEVYKTWLEPNPPRLLIGEKLDSARQNLASSFVNGFVNAASGLDRLLTVDGGNKWIHRNKEHAMISATASLGLLYLWDVDGGLSPIDKYLYTNDDYIRAGALMAIGMVNCKVTEECDPAFALLSDYVCNPSNTVQVGAIFGIALAYVGTNRNDVLDLLVPVIETTTAAETLGVAGLSCGLVCLGMNTTGLAAVLINRLLELRHSEVLKSPYMRLAALGVGLCCFGLRENAAATLEALEVFEEPFSSMAQTMTTMCAYAGTGDVLVIQELCTIVGEKLDQYIDDTKAAGGDKTDAAVKAETATKGDATAKGASSPKITTIKAPADDKSKGKKEAKKRYNWDYYIGQAVATIAIAVVSKGEELSEEMVLRILGNIGRYGNSSLRKSVPLAIAYSSISNPQMHVVDVLSKYSHDIDDEVACNAIFGLGLVGAGTNNTRLAQGLRHLAAYHHKNPSQLFMVRIAQGLVHLGKGTMTLNPMYCDRQLMDSVCVAGLITTLIAMVEPHAMILGRSHYLLFALAPAINMRWLLTLDDEMNQISVPVRVGQAVDVVGKAGTPKTIVGIHTHYTPIVLAAGERAELATDDYQPLTHILEGICILKKKPGAAACD